MGYSGQIFPSTSGNYVAFTGVQLEKGSVATPFEVRPYAVELQLCQRYYYATAYPPTASGNGNGGYSGIAGAANNIMTPIKPPVPMRVSLANATFAIYNNGTQNSVRVTSSGGAVSGLTVPTLNTGSSTGSSAGYIFFTNSLLTAGTGYDFDFTLSAEL
jgi:hypothetical protein